MIGLTAHEASGSLYVPWYFKAIDIRIIRYRETVLILRANQACAAWFLEITFPTSLGLHVHTF